MNAQTTAIEAPTRTTSGGGPLLGVTTMTRKELTEWIRGPKALIILGVSVFTAIFMTVIPFIADKTGGAEQAGLLSHDPTANVLLGWTGQTVAVMAVLATMALVSTERDRGTLAWSLSNPLSPTSILVSKFAVAMVIYSLVAVVVPLLIQIPLATVVYGALPDLRTVGTFGLLFLTLPAFYIGLTVALGAAVKSTVGVAGIAFAVMFVPAAIGGLIPFVNEISPTSIGAWALHVAKGQPASVLTPIAWLMTMAVLAVGAKLTFDRQEL
jgi:ABC-type transport system involved in multi-copper enzyme maturation permease subunit